MNSSWRFDCLLILGVLIGLVTIAHLPAQDGNNNFLIAYTDPTDDTIIDSNTRDIISGSDLDQDGIYEVIVTDYSNGGQAHVFEVISDNNLAWVWSSPGTTSPTTFPTREVKVGDLDGDGFGEVLLSITQSEAPAGVAGLHVFEWDGINDNGYGSSPDAIIPIDPTLTSGFTEDFIIDDIDGDGRQEIIYPNFGDSGPDDRCYILSISGTFETSWSVVTEALYTRDAGDFENSPYDVVTSDLDGDGFREAVFSIWDTGKIFIVESTGTDSYVAAAFVHIDPEDDGASLEGMAAADLDGNGADELLFANYQTEQLLLITGGTDVSGINLDDNVFVLREGVARLGMTIGDQDHGADSDGPDIYLSQYGSGDRGGYIQDFEFIGSDVTDPDSYVEYVIFQDTEIFSPAGLFQLDAPIVDLDGDGNKELLLTYTGDSPNGMQLRIFEFNSLAPSLSVTFPNGGEDLTAGTTQTISWTSTNYIGGLSIEYSIDAGGSWKEVANYVPNWGSLDVTVPFEPTTEALVQIFEAGSGNPSDESDGFFTISVGDLVHFTDVVSPTGRSQPVYIVDANLYGEQLEPGDEIGIYDGDLLVGADIVIEFPMANPITVYLEYTPPGGDPLPGAQDGNMMTFRVWNWGADLEEPANVSEIITGDTIFAESAITAVSLNAWHTQLIAIRPAFLNLISLGVIPIDSTAVAVFDPLYTWLVTAQDHDGNVYIPPDIVFPGHPGTNTIDDYTGMKLEKGYNVFISGAEEQTLEVTGRPVNLDETPIDISPAFLNKISYPVLEAQFIQNVFSETANDHIYYDLSIVQDHDGYVYTPLDVVFPGHPGSNTIDDNGGMQPGKGYMLFHRNEEVLSFNYPQPMDGGASPEIPDNQGEIVLEYFEFLRTGIPHAVFVKNINVELDEGDELGVFAKGKCVGGKRYTGDLNDPVTIWCAEPEYDLKGIEDGNYLEMRWWRSSDQSIEILNLEGDVEFSKERIFSLIKISSDAASGDVHVHSEMIPKEMSLSQNYPNPFNPTTTIEFSLNKNTDVSLFIYNVRGEVVRRLISDFYSAGIYQIEWDSRNDHGYQVASGIYFYRLKAGSFVKNRKMVFTK
jgi:hypothetical protein